MNRTILCIIAISLGLLYCSGDSRTTANLYISVSVQPQKFFVEKIGGDKVEVSVMVPPGADPHVYEPKPQQMVELSK
ncbi:MAG: zinc ABC transporter solute-binding protein, partial [bacterium]|nr:zinc ABC transporter solute-binding protein [bacterium]